MSDDHQKVDLLEELEIESKLVPNRRGELYRLAAEEIRKYRRDADTVYRVKVVVSREEWREVVAVTAAEAVAQAARMPDVWHVVHALHYSAFCMNCDCPLPEGCGGTFIKDKSCRLRSAWSACTCVAREGLHDPSCPLFDR